jgi:hypothetical protein
LLVVQWSMLRWPLVLIAIAGCVGGQGTRKRAYAIDTVISVVGGGMLLAGFSRGLDLGDSLALSIFGLTLATAGVGGVTLTTIGYAGERSRDGHGDPVVAVRPWTSRSARAPFDVANKPILKTALEAARLGHCEEALVDVDAMWIVDKEIHAQLVRDPAIALCIDHGEVAP